MASVLGQAAADKSSFGVKIQTPESIVWEGAARSISTENSAGRFDILPQHANMITIIEGHPIEIVTMYGNRKFVFEKAVLVVKDNAVSVYANISAEKTGSENLRQIK